MLYKYQQLISSPRTDHPLKPDIKRANQPTRNEDKTKAQTQKNRQIPRSNPIKFLPPDSQNGAAAHGKPTPTKLKRDKPRQSRALKLTSPTRSSQRRMRRPPMMRMKSVARIKRRLTGSVGCISARLCSRSS